MPKPDLAGARCVRINARLSFHTFVLSGRARRLRSVHDDYLLAVIGSAQIMLLN